MEERNRKYSFHDPNKIRKNKKVIEVAKSHGVNQFFILIYNLKGSKSCSNIYRCN